MAVSLLSTVVNQDQTVLFEQSYLPHAPLAAMVKTGPYRRTSRENALALPYIEANPACIQSLIIADIDAADVIDLPRLCGLPPATWSVRTQNPVGTGHIGYALADPVCLTNAAKRRPVNLLARVETGITTVLGGDPAYSGRIMKNPLAPGDNQLTLWDEDFPCYGLYELAAALDKIRALPAATDPRPRHTSGVGRNVDIFDRLRCWGYRAIKHYWADEQEAWLEAVAIKATDLNLALENESREPLPEKEIRRLARSVAWWIWQKFTPAAFSTIQSYRGRKGAEKRWGTSRHTAIQEAINDH